MYNLYKYFILISHVTMARRPTLAAGLLGLTGIGSPYSHPEHQEISPRDSREENRLLGKNRSTGNQ